MDGNTIGPPAVIIGPKGLRSGWRLLIFLLMLVAMGAAARAIIIRFLIPAGFAPEKLTPSSVAVQDAFFVPIVALAAWVMSKIAQRTYKRELLFHFHFPSRTKSSIGYGQIFLILPTQKVS